MAAPAISPPFRPLIVFGVLALVLALRMLHFSSALQSPLSYQPGPDEDYYLRFGSAVAAGVGEYSPEFTFMDPGYGYLLGAAFKLFGVNQFAVYLLQTLLDTGTAYSILLIGRRLDRPRAGLYGAMLYGVTATAIMFCDTLLKETCVASFLVWWVAAALAVMHSERRLAWLGFGLLCGLGVALRSTLMLLILPALALTSWAGSRLLWSRLPLVLAGLALSLAPLSLRNYHAFGGLSPLPLNGGIVLHQAYNSDNPRSAIWIPSFVNYSHPSAIWQGYAAEAARRAGRALTAPEVDRLWRGEGFAFMAAHPVEVAKNVGRKALLFLAATEVPNNRSSAEERLFSPVLSWLPSPAPWLLSMGLVGLTWFALQDRRWPIVAAPLVLCWVTFAGFWAEDRFRFHAMPLLALCSGIWIDAVARAWSGVRHWRLPAITVAAALVAGSSLCLGLLYPPPPIRWDHVVWGYIKMGKKSAARVLADRVASEQPDNAPIMEAEGYLAASERHYDAAISAYERSLQLRPNSYLAHYNLAKALLAVGDKARAQTEANISMSLSPSPDTQALAAEIAAAP